MRRRLWAPFACRAVPDRTGTRHGLHRAAISDYAMAKQSAQRVDGGMNSITLIPIGTVRSTRSAAADGNWDTERAAIELDPAQFTPEALSGLQDFFHAEILFYMDKVNPAKVEKTARHPRNNASWPKAGIFAQRGKNRPNQTGATICRIVRVEGVKLFVEGLDAIDGTPVLDIKPWFTEFGPRGSVFQPQWVSELMRGYWRLEAGEPA